MSQILDGLYTKMYDGTHQVQPLEEWLKDMGWTLEEYNRLYPKKV